LAEKKAVRRITIRDVARRADASTAAVSRVLRGAYGVSKGMTARVQAAMKELDYRPHAPARGMRGSTYTIGVMHPDLRNSFFPDVISAIADDVMPSGRQLFMATSEWSSAEAILTAMYDQRIEGVVAIAPTISVAKLEKAAGLVPLVLTHRHIRSAAYDTIVSDDDVGADMVVQHLVELGHRRIVHLGPASGRHASNVSYVAARRAQAYLRAMKRHGLSRYGEVAECAYTVEDGYRVGRALLARKARPTAVFAGTDHVAFGVLQAAYELNLSVPAQLSVVGYDNTHLGSLAPLSLTTVDQNPREIGTNAAKLLMSRIAGRSEGQLISLTPRLITRGTTAPPAD
jgi:LacI family transcriptional regulator